jgi:Tfp pilus assembly major pilin PilA
MAKKTAAEERAMRLRQNKGVKGGTIRVGAKGKTTRRYNAKTGRWDVVSKSSPVARTSRAARTMAKEKSGTSKLSVGAQATTRKKTTTTPSHLTGFSVNKPGSIGTKGGYGNLQSAKPEKRDTGPKKGETKTTMSGVAIYNGTKWVRAVQKNGKWVTP